MVEKNDNYCDLVFGKKDILNYTPMMLLWCSFVCLFLVHWKVYATQMVTTILLVWCSFEQIPSFVGAIELIAAFFIGLVPTESWRVPCCTCRSILLLFLVPFPGWLWCLWDGEGPPQEKRTPSVYSLDGLGKLGEPLRFLLRRLRCSLGWPHDCLLFEEWCFDVVVMEWVCMLVGYDKSFAFS